MPYELVFREVNIDKSKLEVTVAAHMQGKSIVKAGKLVFRWHAWESFKESRQFRIIELQTEPQLLHAYIDGQDRTVWGVEGPNDVAWFGAEEDAKYYQELRNAIRR